MRILFKYATRQRPQWCLKTLATYYKMISGRHDCSFVMTIDADDATMTNNAMLSRLSMFPDLTLFSSDHENKIDAINDDIPEDGWDVLIIVSDDMVPVVEGFDDIIAKDMEKYFPAYDGALHYNDALYGKNNTITYSIMGVNLYKTIGYAYHPDYKSIYCDNEFTAVVRKMDSYRYVDRVLVEHQWCGFDSPDALCKINDAKGRTDSDTYRKRMQAGYPKNSIFVKGPVV